MKQHFGTAMDFLASSRCQLYLTIFWIIMAFPTVLLWNQSILWIGFMSVYAIIVSHWTNQQAARAKEEAEKTQDCAC